MKERFAAKKPRSGMLRFHTQTSGATLTAQQPEMNVVRVALQALAAVLGGTQSLHTNSKDEALALPTEEAALVALRTQQVIAHESGVADIVDPLGGSYFIEAMTLEIEQRAGDYIARIDRMGGMLHAIESGFVQKEIQESAYEYQRAIEKQGQIVVGVNSFVAEHENPIPILRINPGLEEEQKKKVAAVRAEREASQVQAALARVEETARDPKSNLMPCILEAVEAYATVGEISDAMRRVFGEYQEAVVI
jgi:methylmalonyl-CoA mutase N-terminal domain/subunit